MEKKLQFGSGTGDKGDIYWDSQKVRSGFFKIL